MALIDPICAHCGQEIEGEFPTFIDRITCPHCGAVMLWDVDEAPNGNLFGYCWRVIIDGREYDPDGGGE